MSGSWGYYDDDGWLDLFVGSSYSSERNFLYHNDRDGTFTLIDDATMPKIPSNQHGTAWGDYDNDGLLDLFIGGHDIHNRLFHNDGGGSFTRLLEHVLVNDQSGGPSSEGRAWVDYDNDGDLDLYVSNVFVRPSPKFTSVLYRNDGDGQFTRNSKSGLSKFPERTFSACWAGSCAWGDYDNDGFIDLFVTAGGFPDPVPNFLYHNDGDGRFTRVTESPVADPATGAQSASWVDYDNDGFLDLFVTQGAIAPDPQVNLLYHNNGNDNGWLNVKLVGTVSNRSAIGAKVRVKAFYRGARRWQVREISGGDGNGNQQSLNAEFGLGDATTVDTIRVEWPSGIVQELHDVAPSQFLTITETPD